MGGGDEPAMEATDAETLVDRFVSDKTNHSGFHSFYKIAVRKEVDTIEDNIKNYYEDLRKKRMSENKVKKKALSP